VPKQQSASVSMSQQQSAWQHSSIKSIQQLKAVNSIQQHLAVSSRCEQHFKQNSVFRVMVREAVSSSQHSAVFTSQHYKPVRNQQHSAAFSSRQHLVSQADSKASTSARMAKLSHVWPTMCLSCAVMYEMDSGSTQSASTCMPGTNKCQNQNGQNESSCLAYNRSRLLSNA
jgi:hypothetical protein